MNKKYLVSGIAFAAIIIFSFFLFNKKETIVEPTYQEIVVKKSDITIGVTSDTLVTADIVSITAPVAEKVTSVSVRVGSVVKKGQNLMTFDATKLSYQYNTAMANYSKAIYERNQIDRTLKPDDWSAAQQVVNSMYNQVQIAKVARDSTVIKSPVDGVIASVSTNSGEFPQGGSALITIMRNNSTYLISYLDEADIMKISSNMVVNVTLSAGKFTAKVSSIAPTAQKDSAGYSVYPVTIALTNEYKAKVKPGFEGTAVFVTKQVTGVLSIPVATVARENDKTYVLQYNESKEIIKIFIETGFTDGKMVEVKSGLAQGDKILQRK